jgi:hypothetical protein
MRPWLAPAPLARLLGSLALGSLRSELVMTLRFHRGVTQPWPIIDNGDPAGLFTPGECWTAALLVVVAIVLIIGIGTVELMALR